LTSWWDIVVLWGWSLLEGGMTIVLGSGWGFLIWARAALLLISREVFSSLVLRWVHSIKDWSQVLLRRFTSLDVVLLLNLRWGDVVSSFLDD
jgi:hypothetical protein